MKTLRAIVACLMAFTIVFSAVSIIGRTELFSGVKNTVAEGVNNITETFGDMNNASLEELVQQINKGEDELEVAPLGSSSMDKDNLTDLLIEQLTESKTDDVSLDSEKLLENLNDDGSFKVPFDEIYPEAISEGIVEFDDTSLLIKKSKDNRGISFDMIWAGVAKLEVLFEIENDIWYTAKLIKGVDVTKTVEKLRQLEEIKSVDYDYKMQTTAMAQAQEIPEIMCKNEKVNDQWYMKYCGIANGFGQLKKMGGAPDVIVAVIDTGVDFDHQDLKNNIWVNKNETPNNGIDDDDNGYIDDYYGVNVVSGKGNGDDDNGHGTHVAGIIAAENNSIGTVGIAFNTKIMPVKAAASNGIFLQSDIAKAVLYAYENGAEVINMSFGGGACSQAVQDALSVAYSRCVLVASAGNDGKSNEYYPGCDKENILPNYPAALDYVLGVMSVGALGVESLFTNFDGVNYSPVEYELYAPGEAIISTIPNNKYASWSGTSMAAPIVSAVAATLRAEYEDRDSYPTKFIYGQLASTSGDSATCLYPLNHSGAHNTPNIVNLYDALNKTPTPNVQLKDYAVFDTAGFEHDTLNKNNGDGVIDSGETIALGLTLVNQWGMSKDTTVTIDTLTSAGMTDPYIEIVNPTVNYGSIGTYSKKDCGKIYTDEMLTGWENPFYIKVSNDCPNDYIFTLNVNISAKNGLDESDNVTYASTGKIVLTVRNGVVLPSIIEKDMTLTKENLYIIPNGTLIPEGVTVNVDPGTHIQFWSNDPNDPYASQYIAKLVVKGNFIVNGTSEEMVKIYPSELMSDYCVRIIKEDGAYVKLSYVEMTNLACDCIGGELIDWVDNSIFKLNHIGKKLSDKVVRSTTGAIDSKTINDNYPGFLVSKNNVFYKLTNTKLFIGDEFSGNVVVGGNVTIEYSVSHFPICKNNLFVARNKFEPSQQGTPFIRVRSCHTVNYNTYYITCSNDVTVFCTNSASDIGLIRQMVTASGGNFVKIETVEEKQFWDKIANSVPKKFDLIFNENLGEYVWYDGTELPEFLKVAGVTDKKSKYVPIYYKGTFVLPSSSDFYEGNPICYPFEIPGIYSSEYSLKQALLDGYKNNPISNIENNAFINPISTTTDTSDWFKMYAGEVGAENTCLIENNYWGTTNEEAIELQIFDGKDNIDYARLDATPYLTTPPENTFPFVTDVTILNEDGEEVTTVGNEEITVRVEFNRDMDTTIPLNVSFGSSQPYGDYTIEGEYVDERTWEGTYVLTTLIENGSQFFKIGNGCAKDTTFKLYEDVARFGFEIDTTAAQAMLMQGEATATGIELTWQQDDFETLVGYNIYRSTSEDGFYQKLNSAVIPVGEETFFDGSAEPGQVYYYNFTVVKSDLSESLPSGKIVIQAKDTMAPDIYHSNPGTAFMGENLVLTATITDNLSVQSAKIYYRTTGETEWKVSVMNKLNDKYSSIIQSSEITIDGLEYYIEAFDGVSYTYKGNESLPYKIIVKEAISTNALGDVNGDGVITNLDALMILQAINDQRNLSDEEYVRADINGDHNLTPEDALRVLHYVSGVSSSLTA